MKQDAAKDFKNAVDKAFTTEPGVKINSSTMKDAVQLKQSFKEQDEELEGGMGDRMTLKKLSELHKVSLWDLVSQFDLGVDVEREHTNDLKKAMEIAIDHLTEDPRYYTKLKKIETKEQIVVKPVSKKNMKKIIDNAENNWEKETEKKVTAKSQFASDLQKDTDFEEFKKNAKYKKGFSEFSFGIPNVTKEDPYIKKRKWSRPGKEEATEASSFAQQAAIAINMKKKGVKPKKKSEATEATGSGSSGAFSGPIAFKDSKFLRNSFKETPKLKEGLATNAMGLHGIEKAETKEATGSGSVGGYETPSMWAKSTKKKDWGPSRKTQYKGGSFVKVKKKCTKFPYCNQGDINALILSKNESVKEAIKSVSKKFNLSEKLIVNILEHEFQKMNKRAK